MICLGNKICVCFAIVITLGHYFAVAQKKPSNPVVNNKTAISDNKPDYTNVYDTLYNGWVKMVSGNIHDKNFVADRKGNIYSLQGPGYRQQELYKLVNNKWVNMQPKEPGYCYKIWFTKKDEMVIQTFENIFLLTNDIWKPITDEKEVDRLKTERYSIFEIWKNISFPPSSLIRYPKKIMYAYGRNMLIGYAPEDAGVILVELVNGTWKKIAEYRQGFLDLSAIYSEFKEYINNLVFIGDTLCLIKPDGIYQFDNKYTLTPRKKYRITTLPVSGINPETDKVAAIRGTIGIFEVNGKKGLRNTSGDTLIYPVFQSITLERGYSAYGNGDHQEEYILHLVGENMDFKANNTKNPEVLRGFIESVRKCLVCNGNPKFEPDKVEKVKEEIKEWVPEKKEFVRTGTSTAASGQYNPTTKKYEAVPMGYEKVIPGHWKMVGWKEREKIIPGKSCTACNAGKIKYFTTRKEFHFDKASNSYLPKVVNQTFD